MPGEITQQLWSERSSEQVAALYRLQAPFAFAGILRGIMTGHDVEIEGPIDAVLLRNLEEYVDTWATWQPSLYRPIGIRAASEPPRPSAVRPDPSRAVACFSGGVDACLSLYAHHQGARAHRNPHVASGMLVQGFDIRLDQTERFAVAERDARAILDSLEVLLVVVRTNGRSIVKMWRYSHGAALSACPWIFGIPSALGSSAVATVRT